jgi:predicted HicB family RNase H-like nuclease
MEKNPEIFDGTEVRIRESEKGTTANKIYTVRMDSNLARRCRVAAAINGQTQTALIIQGLREAVEAIEKKYALKYLGGDKGGGGDPAGEE